MHEEQKDSFEIQMIRINTLFTTSIAKKNGNRNNKMHKDLI